MFKEVGLIEKYGTGIRRIRQGFADYGLPEPRFEEIGGGFRVTAYKSMDSMEKATQVTEQVTGSKLKLIAFCVEPKSRKELMAHLDIKHREHFRSTLLAKALQLGLIETTIPDRPHSRLQKYRVTAIGKRLLAQKAHDRSWFQR